MIAHVEGLALEELWLADLAGGRWSAWLTVMPRRSRGRALGQHHLTIPRSELARP